MEFSINAVGFVVLVAVYIGFRRVMRRRHRQAAERVYRNLAGTPGRRQTDCPRCSSPLPPAGSYCPRCGVALPPPLPGKPRARIGFVYAVIVVFGILGLCAFVFAARTSQPVSSPQIARPVVVAP